MRIAAYRFPVVNIVDCFSSVGTELDVALVSSVVLWYTVRSSLGLANDTAAPANCQCSRASSASASPLVLKPNYDKLTRSVADIRPAGWFRKMM